MEKHSSIIVKKINKIKLCALAIQIPCIIFLIFTTLPLIAISTTQLSSLTHTQSYTKPTYFITANLFLVFFITKYVYSKITPIFSRNSLALKLEKNNPELNSSLISSVQFINNRNSKQFNTFSPHLISDLLKETANKIANISVFSAIEPKSIKRLLTTLFIAFSICAVQYVANPTKFVTNLQTGLYPFDVEPNIHQPDINTIKNNITLGDITLHYTYPDYSGLKPKTETNSNGDIKALKGSIVEFHAICNQNIDTANIKFNKNRDILLQITENKILKGEIQLLENGLYNIELGTNKEEDGFNTDYHSIKIINDMFPKITLTDPINNNQMPKLSQNEVINLKYSCKDDYGIKKVGLIYSINNQNKKETGIKDFRKNQLESQNEHNWNLNTIDLQPGDTVDYYLKAEDNDTISGPKTSNSKTYHFKILDHEQKHKEILEQQTTLLDAIKELLTDEITIRKSVSKTMKSTHNKLSKKPHVVMSRETLHRKTKRLIYQFDKTIEKTRNDTMADYTIFYVLNNLRETLNQMTMENITEFRSGLTNIKTDQDFHHFLRQLETAYAREIQFLKESIILLTELYKREKLREFFEKYNNEIDSILNQINNTNTQNQKETRAKLEQLEEIANKIMEKLSAISKRSPLNGKDKNTDKAQAEQQSMKDSLQQNDMESAINAAKNLLNTLKKMLKMAKLSTMQNRSNSTSNILDPINNMIQQLKEVADKESNLAEETTKLSKKIKDRTKEVMDNQLNDFFNIQTEKLNTIKSNISKTETLLENKFIKNSQPQKKDRQNTLKIINRYIGDEIESANNIYKYLNHMFKNRDVIESSKLAKEAQQALKRLNSRVAMLKRSISTKDKEHASSMKNLIELSLNLNKEIVNDLDSLIRKTKQQLSTTLTTEEQELTKNQEKRQKQLKDEAMNIQTNIKGLRNKTPLIGNNITQPMNKALGNMKTAEKKLNKKNLNQAATNEREALYNLQQTKDSLNNLKNMINNNLSYGNGSMKMPTFMIGFQGKPREGSNGTYGVSVEKVEIPSENSYKVPKEFREDILKEIKGNFPKRHEPQNREYFEKLLQ